MFTGHCPEAPAESPVMTKREAGWAAAGAMAAGEKNYRLAVRRRDVVTAKMLTLRQLVSARDYAVMVGATAAVLEAINADLRAATAAIVRCIIR
jgi:hypothetical protein